MTKDIRKRKNTSKIAKLEAKIYKNEPSAVQKSMQHTSSILTFSCKIIPLSRDLVIIEKNPVTYD